MHPSRPATLLLLTWLVAPTSLAAAELQFFVDAPATPVSVAQEVEIVVEDSTPVQLRGYCRADAVGVYFDVFSAAHDGKPSRGYWSDWCARVYDAEGKLLTAVYGGELCATRWAPATEGASAQEKAAALARAPISSRQRAPEVHSCLAALTASYLSPSDAPEAACCSFQDDRDRTPQEMLAELSRNFAQAALQD